MGQVYVTQIPSRQEDGVWVPTIDISPAREFGELRVMSPSGLNHADPSHAVNMFEQALDGFDWEQDYLLPAGDPSLMAIACALLGAKRKPFRMLKWDRQQKRYFSYVVAV